MRMQILWGGRESFSTAPSTAFRPFTETPDVLNRESSGGTV